MGLVSPSLPGSNTERATLALQVAQRLNATAESAPSANAVARPIISGQDIECNQKLSYLNTQMIICIPMGSPCFEKPLGIFVTGR